MRIVGFEVYPFSVQHELVEGSDNEVKTCKPSDFGSQNVKPMVVKEDAQVIFTYEAEFQVGVGVVWVSKLAITYNN